ncbi:alanine/glycine:cation symporter family protein [Roseiconus lacunae]|uniref:Alanine/glycine:cation symporter family protein n=1 Tax=Roseiconus lacunae TaxID=2605694 RepID=A0ABT7PGB2_9BACT|nr:alanine/glycine:cation symporter family protein [Roseiconus lacunae]MDM4015349.1 alanine/glycine:cation symporter family protein [Roseiconus lacunae]WRQ52973.1 alanine/glycine:cation symporter family protein [Stieleria sp. HD01]
MKLSRIMPSGFKPFGLVILLTIIVTQLAGAATAQDDSDRSTANQIESSAVEVPSAEVAADDTPVEQPLPPQQPEVEEAGGEDAVEPGLVESGLDQAIDKAFKPIADRWGSIVFFTIPIPGLENVPFVVLLLVFGAAFFTVAFGFANVRLLPLAIRVVRGRYDELEKLGEEIPKHVDVYEVDGDLVDTIRDEAEGEVSHFQALATAVSGTVGLGNIAGVAVAVATGGPGATFWMIICGLLGMSSKFVECTLGVRYRDVEEDGTVHGGPMYYLRKGVADMGLTGLGKVLGVLFALFCIGASFGGGNAFQANQAAQQIKTLFGLPDTGASGTFIGIGMAIMVGFVIIGGIKRIASWTEKIVPLMAAIYCIAALIIIVMNLGSVPWAIKEIVAGAFTPEAGVGGVMGVLIQGFQRAAFSNEAGTGSAAIAHSAVKTKYPASEGVVALLEPFIDTVVICTMTAIVIVLFNGGTLFQWGDVQSKAVLIEGVRVGGVDLTSRAFDSVLPGFKYILTIAIFLFAFSTMISWSYYGLQSWKYLFGKSQAADLSYKLLFCIVIVIGAAVSLGSVIDFSDAMIFAMVFPNMCGLLLLFPRVREELRRYLDACENADTPS